jgi:hypothetical protein
MIGVLFSNSYPGQWLPLAIFYSVLVGFSFLGVLLLRSPDSEKQTSDPNSSPTTTRPSTLLLHINAGLERRRLRAPPR